MARHTAQAEYDRLREVRVHKPGMETFLGTLAPEPNLFLDSFDIGAAQQEHDEMVEVLNDFLGEDNVHHIHDDLADGPLRDMVRGDVPHGGVNIDTAMLDSPGETYGEMWDDIDGRSSYEQLQALLVNPDIRRTPAPSRPGDDRADDVTYTMENPITNLFFQRDQQFLGDRGPVMGKMAKQVRQPEVAIAQAAWEGIGADPVYAVQGDDTLEGGEFIPAGDVALIGVDPAGDAEPLRTTYGAAEQVLENGAVGYPEVGLVRAPVAEEERLKAAHNDGDTEADMHIMHLDTWFNVAAHDVAVMDEDLARNTTVDVYRMTEDGDYVQDRTETFHDYVTGEMDMEVVHAGYEARPEAANFLTLDDGVVLPIYRTDDSGAYDADDPANAVIEEMQDIGIEVVPDGRGLDLDNLTNGYGGVHCMTTPLDRG